MYVYTICKQFNQLKRSRELKQREVVLPMQESRGRGFNTTQAGLEVCAYIVGDFFFNHKNHEAQKSRALVSPNCHYIIHTRKACA